MCLIHLTLNISLSLPFPPPNLWYHTWMVATAISPGAVYYSDPSGDLTTEGTDFRVGLAISSNEILLDSNRENVDQFFGDIVFANNFRITEGSAFEGLILKNQLDREILVVDEEGILNINGLSFNNPATQKIGWLMFEDQQGPGLQNIHTGKIYDFVLRERNKTLKPDSPINFEKAIKELQAEVKALKTQIQTKK